MELFGQDHLLVLGCTALVAAGLGTAVRAHPALPAWRVLEIGMSLVLIGVVAYFPIVNAADGTFASRDDLPLHASDVTALLAAAALVSRRQLAFEIAFFWGLTGGVAALVTPDLASSFPEDGWWVFILGHSLAVVAAIELSVGRGMRPRPFSSLWAAGGALVFAAIAGTASAVTGGNYMFTREPPGSSSPLDVMGPWPWYLLGGVAIGLIAFTLLEAPFRAADRRRATLASRQLWRQG